MQYSLLLKNATQYCTGVRQYRYMVARGGAQLAWKKIYPQVEQGPVQGGHGCSEWLVKYPGSKIGYCLRLEKLRSDNLKLNKL